MKNLSSELLNKFEGLYKKGYYIMNDNFLTISSLKSLSTRNI